MADINQLVIIGRLTRDIGDGDFRYTPNGKAVLSFSIAVNMGYGDKASVSYFDVSVYGKTAENIKPYLNRGKQIAIAGLIKQDRWEKDGQKHSRVGIIANTVQLLGGKSESTQPAGNYQPAPATAYEPESDGDAFPEDIPF